MADTDPIKLLLVHDQVDEANRLLSLLRNAGYQVSSKQVESEADLPKLLQNAKWDLILAQHECSQVSIQSVFHNLRRLNRDIPVIVITDNRETGIVECLRMGATDTILLDDDQHLLLSVSRALYDLSQRRRLRFWKRRYSEAEARCGELLDSSKDAIAIVKEGTYIYTNDSYAQLFGYLDKDEMECLPVIDSVAPESQAKVKPLLKALFTDEILESSDISFTGMRADELPIEVQMHASQVEYENEPALQLLIKSSPANVPVTSDQSASSQSDITEIRLHKLIDAINGAIRRAAQMNKDSMLMMVQLDNFNHLRAEHGIQMCEELIRLVAKEVVSRTKEEHTIGRYQQDSFLMLLPSTDADTCLRLAESLCSQIAGKVLEVGEKTFPVTLSIGLSVISETASTVEGSIQRCSDAIDGLRSENTSDQVGNGARLYELEFAPSINEIDANTEMMGRRLLGNGQFELLFQPIIALQGESKSFYEVSVQVKAEANPKDYPVDFITQLFKTDAAKDIDHWIINEAIQHLISTQKESPETIICLNISRSTFCDPAFIDWLKGTLKSTGVQPESLVLQLREIDMASYLNQVVSVTEQLKAIHCQVALTHFGLAIDPMQLLSRVEVDYVKLDRLLVEKAHKDEEGLDAMETMINTLRGHHENIIVPFIESPSMMPSLWKLGVQYIQGHYIQPPQTTMCYDFNQEGE